MMETLQRQSEYLSYAISKGLHEMSTESAMKGVKSLGKSEAAWASAWTGEDPTSYQVDGVKYSLTAAEIQATKAKWAMNSAAQSIMKGKTFTDGSLTIDAGDIQQATATATKEAMADVQEKARNIASQVASTAEAIQNMQQGIAAEVGQELAASLTEIVAANAGLTEDVTERAIETIADLEDILGIDPATLVSDTSSWTESDWANSWTGTDPTSYQVDGVKYSMTEAEIQATKAQWAKNQAERYGN